MMIGPDDFPDQVEVGRVIFKKVADNLWEVEKWEGLTLCVQDGKLLLQLGGLPAPPCASLEECEKALEGLIQGVNKGVSHLLDRARTQRNAEAGRKLDS